MCAGKDVSSRVWKTTPEFGSSGLKITPVLRPVKRPFPFKTTLPFNVLCWRSESLSLTAPEGMIGLIILATLFAMGGKFLLTLPLTLVSLALLKLKGLSIFQLISLFRLIQTLRKSGRFSFNQSNLNNQSSISVSEAVSYTHLTLPTKA